MVVGGGLSDRLGALGALGALQALQCFPPLVFPRKGRRTKIRGKIKGEKGGNQREKKRGNQRGNQREEAVSVPVSHGDPLAPSDNCGGRRGVMGFPHGRWVMGSPCPCVPIVAPWCLHVLESP